MMLVQLTAAQDDSEKKIKLLAPVRMSCFQIQVHEIRLLSVSACVTLEMEDGSSFLRII
jgi:hypothetical protein